ncbi:hypothetical protein ACET3Z_025910 [Daucus carota]
MSSSDSEITVLVPELEKIGVRRPAWYSDQGTPGQKNLLSSFNRVGQNSCPGRRSNTGMKDTTTGRSMKSHESETFVRGGTSDDYGGPDFASTSAMNNGDGTEDEADTHAEEAEEAGRGQYTTHDVDDNRVDMPGVHQYFVNSFSLPCIDFWEGYMDLGPPTELCSKCKAVMWNEERNNKGEVDLTISMKSFGSV